MSAQTRDKKKKKERKKRGNIGKKKKEEPKKKTECSARRILFAYILIATFKSDIQS